MASLHRLLVEGTLRGALTHERAEMYELLAFFGDYAEEYEDKVRRMLDEYPWDVIVHYMDDDVREETHMEYAPCDNETFLLAYMAGHITKFGEDFEIN